MKNKRIFLTSVLALITSYSLSAFAVGVSITDHHPNDITYQSFTENFVPSSVTGAPGNIGTWSYNGIDAGKSDQDNGVGNITKLDDGKYAVQIGETHWWHISHPSLGTHELSSPFTGNYLEKRVVSLSFETRVLNELIFSGGRPISLVLRGPDGFTLYKTMQHCEPKGNGVDCENIRLLSKDWAKFTFPIPKTWVEAKHDGWGVYNSNDGGPTYELEDHFTDVMSNVEKVDFMFGAPRLIYALQNYHIQATNLTITTHPQK